MAAVVLLTSCAPDAPQYRATADLPPITVDPAPIGPATWQQRGETVTQSAFPVVAPALSGIRAEAFRATYRSVSAVTGREVDVTGVFFVPAGVPPDGGWPVIALGHGTTGALNNCGLSTDSALRGYAPLVAGMVDQGFAVAITDYEGLGPNGVHPFLEPRTAAFNLIDSVRALRHLAPTVSTRWLAYGISQGGQTAWAAAELDDWYGNGLDLVGAVALAPAANIVGFSELAERHELTDEQLMIAPMVIAGLARYDSSVVLDNYVRGPVRDLLDVLIGCQPSAPVDRATVVTAGDVGPTTPSDAATLADALRRIALPQRPLSVPLLVVNGLQDQAIFPQWVAGAVARSCDLGGSVEHREISGAGHGDVQPDEDVWSWIADRFAGEPAGSSCASSS
ncbi:lipase family protein [Mycobacterium sp. pV006]|uniref:lipase family protein n=1 Tax=Mycobacterium sp. pV006 TaxID=3238983 RepID=UPI00351BCE8F